MKYLAPILLLSIFAFSCEKEELADRTPDEPDLITEITGQYQLSSTMTYPFWEPNDGPDQLPEDFRVSIFRSDYSDEVTLLGLSGFSKCIYATAVDGGFEIPLQQTNIQEEEIGFHIVPDFPDVTLSVSGFLHVKEVARTPEEGPHYEISLDFRWFYDGTTLARVITADVDARADDIGKKTCE